MGFRARDQLDSAHGPGHRAGHPTIAVLSGNYLKSVYGGAEWQAAWARDPQGAGRKLLVVRVADCDCPGCLAGVVGVDLFGLTDAAATARLRGMVATAIAGRAKPATAPAFPGAGPGDRRASPLPRTGAADMESSCT